jgi:microcystin-dependent protein
MTDSGYVFNPYLFAQDKVNGLTTETIEQLDDRYINVGEDVFSENIDTLNVGSLNISSAGKIYFGLDNTEQTTAYDPTVTNAQIQNFAHTNNTFTGENKFSNFKVFDDFNNNQTKIYHSGNNTNIENSQPFGTINLNTFDLRGLAKTLSFDSSGNINGINDVFCSRLRPTTSLVIGSTVTFSNDSNNNLIIQNGSPGQEIRLRPTASSGASWLMSFNPNGQLSGMNNVICHSVESQAYKFRDQTTFNLINDSQIYQSGGDIIIENGSLPGTFKLKLKRSDGVQNILQISELMNVSGVNDLTMTGILKINNTTHKSDNSSYVIDNKNNGSSIYIKNYDTNGVLRQIIMDPLMNTSGINDLYCSRLFVNNISFNPTDFNNTQSNTQQIRYQSTPLKETRVVTNSSIITFIPEATLPGAYNNMCQYGDNIMCTINPTNSAVLSLTTGSPTIKTGFRIKPTETEAYNLKVIDGGLKFSDNTVQTTAMTNTYLTSLIQTIINQSLTTLVPVGTIMAYGGDLTSNVPDGYFWCIGGLTTISASQNLFNLIGHKFAYGQTIYAGSYYLPDLRGAYLKGCSYSTMWAGKTTSINNVGDRQTNNVGTHAHQYKDRGSGTYKIVVQNPSPYTSTFVADDSDGNFWTDGLSYDPSTHVQSDSETRPNSIGINYIIKY